MRLADFIAENSEPILAEWVSFAASCGAAGEALDLAALRDHAAAMLAAFVADLRTAQTPSEQRAKSIGHAVPPDGGVTAATVHGSGRAESGFTVGEMVSEYRALRASVIRLWTAANGQLTGVDLEDLMRFNEAIDQSLAESIARYTSDLDRSREVFIAILGHDLRVPLGAVSTASRFMLDTNELTEPHRTLTTRISLSSERMLRMVEDLLDFARGRLGAGVPITRGETDLRLVVRQGVDEMAAAQPTSVLQFTANGDLRGRWDAARISQVVANLLGNAVQHGAPRGLITVAAHGEATEVVLRVHNRGQTIGRDELPGLFSPFKRLRSAGAAETDSGNLGLGLYIAERIVTAHGGSIEVRSSHDGGTLFTVRLPRDRPLVETPLPRVRITAA